MTARWETVEVDGDSMRVFVDAPAGPGPHPGGIVIMGLGGVEGSVQGMVSHLAEQGYAAAAPDLYHRQKDDIMERVAGMEPRDPERRTLMYTKMGQLLDGEVEADVNGVLAMLRSGEVGPAPVGITGFCLGGRVAYLMAARNPELMASAPFYGHNIYVAWGDGPSPLEQTAAIAAPILAFSGEDDENPSPENMRTYDAELTKHGKPHEFVSYSGVGHGFFTFADDGSRRAEVSKDAWARLLDFFEANLKAKVAASTP